jgi:hypothetical protein
MDQAVPSHSTDESGMSQWIHIGPATLKMYVLLLQKAYRRHAMREVKEVIDGLNHMLEQTE